MKKLFVYKLLIVLLMIVIGGIAYTKLPDTVPIHWGPLGYSDATGSKLTNVVLFPLINLVILILFPILGKIDPKSQNYEKFSKVWEIFQFSIMLFFSYMYFVILYLSANPDKSINSFMMLGLGVLFVVIGNYMGKIKQNYFIGIKLPWTLENEEVWNKTHRFSGKLFVVGGILFLLNLFIGLPAFSLFIVILIIILLIPVLYSYLIYKNLKK